MNLDRLFLEAAANEEAWEDHLPKVPSTNVKNPPEDWWRREPRTQRWKPKRGYNPGEGKWFQGSSDSEYSQIDAEWDSEECPECMSLPGEGHDEDCGYGKWYNRTFGGPGIEHMEPDPVRPTKPSEPKSIQQGLEDFNLEQHFPGSTSWDPEADLHDPRFGSRVAMPRPKNTDHHNHYNVGWNASKETISGDMERAEAGYLKRNGGQYHDQWLMGWTDYASDYPHRFRDPDGFLQAMRETYPGQYDDFDLHPETREMVRRQPTVESSLDQLYREAIRKGAPFAEYEDFADCTSKNSDKEDPDAYCGEIKHRTEDKKKAYRGDSSGGYSTENRTSQPWIDETPPKAKPKDWDEWYQEYGQHQGRIADKRWEQAQPSWEDREQWITDSLARGQQEGQQHTGPGEWYHALPQVSFTDNEDTYSPVHQTKSTGGGVWTISPTTIGTDSADPNEQSSWNDWSVAYHHPEVYDGEYIHEQTGFPSQQHAQDYVNKNLDRHDPKQAVASLDKLYREASHNKRAWTGWGPALFPKHHKVAGWDWDDYLNGYVSKTGSTFECECGESLPVPSYRTCKCGKIWNSYPIAQGGDLHTAKADVFLCREIPVREGVILAKKTAHG